MYLYTYVCIAYNISVSGCSYESQVKLQIVLVGDGEMNKCAQITQHQKARHATRSITYPPCIYAPGWAAEMLRMINLLHVLRL